MDVVGSRVDEFRRKVKKERVEKEDGGEGGGHFARS
jgi:hypothetical protein